MEWISEEMVTPFFHVIWHRAKFALLDFKITEEVYTDVGNEYIQANVSLDKQSMSIGFFTTVDEAKKRCCEVVGK